jgi:hypothetical protein
LDGHDGFRGRAQRWRDRMEGPEYLMGGAGS